MDKGYFLSLFFYYFTNRHTFLSLSQKKGTISDFRAALFFLILFTGGEYIPELKSGGSAGAIPQPLGRHYAITRWNLINLNVIKNPDVGRASGKPESFFCLGALKQVGEPSWIWKREGLAIFGAKVMWCKIASEFMHHVGTYPQRWRMAMETGRGRKHWLRGKHILNNGAMTSLISWVMLAVDAVQDGR